MSDIYEEDYHHFVWATKIREPMIFPRMEILLYAYIRQKVYEMKANTHAIGGIPDHIHLVCSLPGSLAPSVFIKNIKGGSSHYINHLPDNDPLYWQVGYGRLTCAKHDLPRVIAYVENQKRHHAIGSLSPKMERISSVTE